MADRRTAQSAILVSAGSHDANRVAQSVILVSAYGLQVATLNKVGGAPKEMHQCNPFLTWNQFDECLRAEIRLHHQMLIARPWGCSIPEELKSNTPWDEEQVALPAWAQILRESNSITTPTTASGD